MGILTSSYANLPEKMFVRESPAPVTNPTGFALNEPLSQKLNLDLGGDWANILSGNALPEHLQPVTQAYAGHQFGHWNPQLGDGRAVLIGEAIHGDTSYDIQLKGSGRTTWSRGGDGRAWLGPVLREYIISEAMHALSIPTTRAVAAVLTGETVIREQGALPGAIITRAAESHIRVGTFQYFAARNDIESLTALRDYTIQKHYPDASSNLTLLKAVCQKQADLIAHWMSVGFIHGVMNTDNCHVGGLTIDYGPCAFMDEFHPMKVYSSIDHYGRYAYGNQPQIASWNLAQFATSLLPLEEDKDTAIGAFTQVIESFATLFENSYHILFSGKLGLPSQNPETQSDIAELRDIMAKNKLDFTNTFRTLSLGIAPDHLHQLAPEWVRQWERRRSDDAQSPCPAIIPRNHQIEAMIQAAVNGDRGPFDKLSAALAIPYQTPSDARLTAPPSDTEVVNYTFCGT